MFIAAYVNPKHLPWLIGIFALGLLAGIGVALS
jgi:riboflavin transporter FmnP